MKQISSLIACIVVMGLLLNGCSVDVNTEEVKATELLQFEGWSDLRLKKFTTPSGLPGIIDSCQCVCKDAEIIFLFAGIDPKTGQYGEVTVCWQS